jgi:single-strand DNA-binding protein
MEQLNRIEIRGSVGSIRMQTFTDNMVARFTVATNYAYKDKEGQAIIDTSWHNVLAREGKFIHDLSKIDKGTKVYVQGRLRYQKYTGSDGVERNSTDIIANRVMIIDDSEPMQYEM